MSREIVMAHCPNCNKDFPVKERKSIPRRILKLGVLVGGGFLVGGPFGALAGTVAEFTWNLHDISCRCQYCGKLVERPSL